MPNTLPLLLLAGGMAYVSSSTVHNARSAATFKVPVVTFHAKEFTFVGAHTIAAGQTTFRLVNDGQVVHHLTILRLARGKSMADVKEAMQTAATWPTWLNAVGGTNAAVPGDSLEATLTLEPGRYVVVCILASPGEQIPHTRKGMFVPLTVAAARGATQAGTDFAPTPVPDIHLELKDYGFVLSKPITAGNHTIRVMNDGPEDHEAVMLRFSPGKRMSDFFAWAMAGAKGPSPAKFINGVATMAKGRTAVFSYHFTPGAYAITCFVDAPDKKPHSAHGMTMEFDVK